MIQAYLLLNQDYFNRKDKKKIDNFLNLLNKIVFELNNQIN